MVTTDVCLRFVPSRVDGLASVMEVAVFPDRLELNHRDGKIVIHFHKIANNYHWGYLGWILARLGWTRGHSFVGDRDWFHPPSERFFRYFTTPPITVYLADEPAGTNYADTLFRRIQDIMAQGGFFTHDLS